MRDSVVFYKSFRDAIKRLPVEEQLKAYDAIMDYAFEGIEVEDGIAAAIFLVVKPQIDANNQRYENGRKGGRPKTESKPSNNQTETKPKPNQNQTITKPEPNVNDNDNVNDNVNDKEKDKEKDKKKVVRFAPPSVDEVKAYCDERSNGIDPESFIDFYSSKGWKVGNQPMKDWQAAIRTWERRHNEKRPEKPVNNPKVHFENERTYDFEAIEKKLLAKQRRVDSG